ncbi:MAG: hypothetical protein J0H08_04835, partial [Rhizobiales bacterium]|nr:hypothetical protein [Hyphomicrobiales bacterium]
MTVTADTTPPGDTAAFSAMPAGRPRAMPVQPISRKAAGRRKAPTTGIRVRWRRTIVLGGTALLGAAAIFQMSRVLEIGGMTPIEILLLVLFSISFTWIGLTLVTALAGLFVRLSQRPGTSE